MKKKTSVDLVIQDFLKYIPKPKRDEYELILRRCNFSDIADPLFPVMLFLLFLQDNLADGTENLAFEVKELKAKLGTGMERNDSKSGSPAWKTVGIIVLLSIQLIFSALCFYRIYTFSVTAVNDGNHEIYPQTTEIQRMNSYWDMKLENAARNQDNLTLPQLFSDRTFQIFFSAALLFAGTVFSLTILLFAYMLKCLRRDRESLLAFEKTRHDFRELCSVQEGEEMLEELQVPPPPPQADGQAPTADTNSWGNIDSTPPNSSMSYFDDENNE